MKKTRRHYDEEFKKLAVDLAMAKGSLTSTAEELGITPDILARWRRERLPQQENHPSSRQQLNLEQQEIIRLKRELKEAQLERDILKNRSAGPRPVSIFSKSDRAADRGKYFDS